jgi:hypothetical protein
MRGMTSILRAFKKISPIQSTAVIWGPNHHPQIPPKTMPTKIKYKSQFLFFIFDRQLFKLITGNPFERL